MNKHIMSLKNQSPMKLEQVNRLVSYAADIGVAQLMTQDDAYNGRTIQINNKTLVNFGSCSYLGLELDERLKQASIDATQRYGIQYSSSRAYVENGLYEEYEGLLEQIFGQPTLLAPTTTLGHIAVLPVIIGDNDAVLFDLQVHNSVQTAIQLLKARGIHTEPVKHNDMNKLEDKIKKLSRGFDKIWYLADGIYSMYGDTMPTSPIQRMLDEYEQFHLYVDDAHGMSWAGEHGRGYILSEMDFHPKMYLTTSLTKGFGCCGGAIVLPDEAAKRLIRNCGSVFIFSGPIPPPVLSAGIASAKIHLSPEINERQEKLRQRIQFFNATTKKYNLPLISKSITPIAFIRVGKPEVGYRVCKRMIARGYFMTLAIYPGVAKNNTGLRATITTQQSYQDIENMLKILSQELDKVLREMGMSREQQHALRRGVALR